MLNERKFTKVKRKIALRRAVCEYKKEELDTMNLMVVIVASAIIGAILKLYWFSILTGIIVTQILLFRMYYKESIEEVEDKDERHREYYS